MTKREKKERKIKKRLEWAEGRYKKSNKASDTAHSVASQIPSGQPILVGHHSEKKHRKAQDTIHNNMSKSIEHSDMADHHQEVARNIQHQLDTTIFSDDPDAIERLQEKVAVLEKKRDRLKEIKKALTKGIDIELTAKEKKHLEGNRRCWNCYNIMPYELTRLGAAIRQSKKRIDKIKNQKIVKKNRYITLLSIAEEKKINHGKSWKCTEKNINDNNLPSDYKDELICYVY